MTTAYLPLGTTGSNARSGMSLLGGNWRGGAPRSR